MPKQELIHSNQTADELQNPDFTDSSNSSESNIAKEGDLAVNDITMRPKLLQEFIGQQQICNHLKIMIEAAKIRNQAVDHILFAGPPGLGKLLWPLSWQMRWGQDLESHRAQYFLGRATLRPYLMI